MSFRHLFCSLALAFCAVLFSRAPLPGQSFEDWTTEDVVERIETVNGGEDAIEEVTNVRVQGEVLTGERTYEFVLLKKRPDKVRIQLHYRMGSVTTGFDGEQAWRRMRQGSEMAMEDLDAAAFAKQSLETDFDGPLIGPVSEGAEREFVGVERVGRVDYLIMEVRYKNSYTRHYVDPRTFREWKMEKFVREDGEWTKAATAIYKDYERFGPFWLATQINRELKNGTTEVLRIQNVELNTAIIDRVFARPSGDGLLGG